MIADLAIDQAQIAIPCASRLGDSHWRARGTCGRHLLIRGVCKWPVEVSLAESVEGAQGIAAAQ